MRAAGAILAGLLALLGCVPTAFAYQPGSLTSCEQYRASPYNASIGSDDVEFFNFAARLRADYRAVFDVRDDTHKADIDRDLHVSIQAADPARPITFPSEADRLTSPALPVDQEVETGEKEGRFTMQFRSGDGDARVVASWPNSYSYTEFSGSSRQTRTGECERSVSKGVTLVPGQAPRMRAKVLRYEESLQGGDTDNLLFDFSEGGFDVDCRESLPGRLTLRVTGMGKALDYTTKNSCYDWADGRRRAAGWKLRDDEDFDVFFLPRMGMGRKTFRYKAVWAGKVVDSGSFRVSVTGRRTRRVYEGTDAFFNVCINENRTVKSHRLRLYCTQPGYVNRRISLIG